VGIVSKYIPGHCSPSLLPALGAHWDWEQKQDAQEWGNGNLREINIQLYPAHVNIGQNIFYSQKEKGVFGTAWPDNFILFNKSYIRRESLFAPSGVHKYI